MSLTVFNYNALAASQSVTATSRTASHVSTNFAFGDTPNAQEDKMPKEPSGKKSYAWREHFIQEHKNDYDIKVVTRKSFKGFTYTIYEVTVKKKANLSQVKKELGLANGVVSSNNDNYGQYDDNGGYIDNKAMQGVTIKIPMDRLGELYDDRNIFEQIWDAIF